MSLADTNLHPAISSIEVMLHCVLTVPARATTYVMMLLLFGLCSARQSLDFLLIISLLKLAHAPYFQHCRDTLDCDIDEVSTDQHQRNCLLFLLIRNHLDAHFESRYKQKLEDFVENIFSKCYIFCETNGMSIYLKKL